MIARVSPIAPPGSLFKSAAPKKKGKGGKPTEVKRDANYLALIRKCPCLSCDQDPAGIAAHVRMTRAGKPITGMGTKPDDRWTLPLCASCHTEGVNAQHKIGEVRFYNNLGIDALVTCQSLYAASPDLERMRNIVFMVRETRK